LILLGAGVYVGWNIGSNDTANCIGTTVGCGLIPFRRAVILVVIFAVLGAVLQGEHVMKTIGKGIVKEDLSYLAVFVALLCSGFFVTLATFFRIPTSTSQAIVGGVMGIGLAVGAEINYSKFIIIAESWIICPIMVMGLAFGLYHLLILILRKIRGNALLVRNAMGWLAIASSCYVAYSMGANNAGNAVGPIANLGILPPKVLLIIGGGAIALGALTYGKKVADTVGKGITPLDIPGAFCAQVASAFGMHLFSMFGIPVSTSSAIVGAVVGVGLVKGSRAISKKTVITILSGWVLTPCSAALSAYMMYKAISYFML
jgi:inorganic phosphate transporter, PiT family